MPAKPQYLYWDASVFSSYVGGIADRLPIIDALFEQVVADRRRRIITSAISLMEVAFASGHGPGLRTSPAQEGRIDELWRSPHIEVVDVTRGLLLRARSFMRDAVDNGWSITPNDALHLVTAAWVHTTLGEVDEVHTYDNWSRFQLMVGDIPIGAPTIQQPRLPYGVE